MLDLCINCLHDQLLSFKISQSLFGSLIISLPVDVACLRGIEEKQKSSPHHYIQVELGFRSV